MSWRAALAQAGGDAVVALVLRKQGSAPREEGR